MNKNILLAFMVLVLGGLCFSGCEKWEDHNALTDSKVGKDLLQQIRENPDLSKFAELLAKTGYDKEIASSKTYTVFAPVNAALASLDAAIVADDAKLRLFVGNHITNQLQSTSATGQVRLQMMNGKYINLQGTMVDDATITGKNIYAKNGYLHITDKMLPALPNAWEFLLTDPQAPEKQKTFLASLIDSTGSNSFLSNVHDLRDESKQYTFFVLTDAAWDAEVARYKPFFVTGTEDSTTTEASRAVVYDFAVEGVYQPASLPDIILSKFNTKLDIDKSAIVKTIKVSNGIVYVMSKLDVQPKDKFQQYIIQGEDYDFSRVNRLGNIYFREKYDATNQKAFKDVLVFGHGVAQFYLGYRLTNVPSMKYKAYWVAVHDNVNSYTGTFKQLLGIGTSTANLLPYVTVSPNNYDEVYLGEFTISTFRPTLNVYLTADNNTTSNTNMITADYIRLEPVL